MLIRGAAQGIGFEDVLEQVLYPLVPQKRLIDASEIAALSHLFMQ